MRDGFVLVAAATALTAISATGVQAEEWCGYGAHAKSIIECGYSTVADCESAIGKGGMCFVDPDDALNTKRATPASRHPEVAATCLCSLGELRRA